jgi:outer membrane protein TolC
MKQAIPRGYTRCAPFLIAALAGSVVLAGCHAALVTWSDRDVAQLIRQRQQSNLGATSDADLGEADRARPGPSASAYQHDPGPLLPPPSADFATPAQSQPSGDMSDENAASQPSQGVDGPAPASQPRRYREEVLTLTRALAFADQHRRQLQTAKEDLYLAALRLTLERHLWTPQFAAELRTIYGNFGEERGFDQAMRYVADLNVAQRLPYGGKFTAGVVSTLARDIGRGITTSEGGEAVLGVDIPLLRGAGHVAREDLIQLNRALTYAVRDYEVFRREQLVRVAQQYFDLLRSKQDVLDAVSSVESAEADYERARAMERADEATILDTGRAVQRLLSESNRMATLQESFRFSTDQFKLLIGLPVDEPLGIDDVEDIGTIERMIEAGEYPLLQTPIAADDEQLALETAVRQRLELLNLRDQVEDAKRGVVVAGNNVLPELNWNTRLTFDTDPNHYRITNYEFDRANWRSEMVLAMDDRFSERNQYRAALIDVRRSQRSLTDLTERVRVDVRRAVNQMRLQERVLQIQVQNLRTAEMRSEYARIQFEEGFIENRDVIEAQNDLVSAQSALSAAKTARWSAVLEFRLATGTLRVDENGRQYDAGGP